MSTIYQKIYSAAYQSLKSSWLAPQDAHKIASFLTSDFVKDFDSLPATGVGYYCRHCAAVPLFPRTK